MQKTVKNETVDYVDPNIGSICKHKGENAVEKKVFYVISHTHWDREWYLPFEKFRMKLVDLVDNLLEVLADYPEYIFHLDAQTVVLEDYLAIKPRNRETLSRYIQEGRLLVGPWYVQNDFYLSSGEATVRNLLIGSRIAGEFGECSRVGYVPDQFGLISQLPQIFNGFAVDNCIFGRGYSFYDKKGHELQLKAMPAEFMWQGEDGSSILAIHLPYWYNNAQRFSADENKSVNLLEWIEKSFESIALTPYLLLMNGVDHLEAQENLIPILAGLNQRISETGRIEQCTMEQYVDRVKAYLHGNKTALSVYQGELRNGTDWQILQGTLSSRIYLKVLNFKAQNLLEGMLEPLYSFLGLMADPSLYPADFMDYLWRSLVKNHAHDSICGCSRDEVHSHMEDRYTRLNEVGEELLHRGLDFIAAHVTRDGITEQDYLITVVNTTEIVRNEVVELELQFPVGENVENFAVTDPQGNPVLFAVLSKIRKNRGIFSPINLPGSMEVDVYRIQLYVEALEGLSYRAYAVKPQSNPARKAAHSEPNGPSGYILENEFLTVSLSPQGRIDLLDKETKREFPNLLELEDTEDCGDSYTYIKAADSATFTSGELIPEITCLRSNSLETAYAVKYRMMLPERFDTASGKRSGKLVENIIEIVLWLAKGSRQLKIGFNIDNTSRDHRLRALLKTGVESDLSLAAAPFEIIKRDRRDVLAGIRNGTQPNSGLIGMAGENGGVAIFTAGIYEYEHLMAETGVIALTLVRANPWISRSIDGNCDADDTWMVPENQCIRKLELMIAVCPYPGKWPESGIANMARTFQIPVLTSFQSADPRKFTGGRPAVQDSEIKEIFYRDDPFAHLILPREKQLLEVKGKNVVLTALKKAERDEMMILRVFNAGESVTEVQVALYGPSIRAGRLNLNEELLEELECAGSSIKPVKLGPKQILTLGIKPIATDVQGKNKCVSDKKEEG